MAPAKQKEMPLDPLAPEERAHFDSRGEKDIPVSQPVETPVAPAQAPAPAAQEPGPTADASQAPPPEKPEVQATVPQAALHEERKRRQEAEEKTRQIELLNVRMEERFRAFRDAMTPPRQPQPQAPPDPNRDIFGAVQHMQAEQRQTRAEIDNYKRQIQAEDQMKALKKWGEDAEAQYVRDNPDYYTALNHLRQTRARELQVWGMTPSAIGAQLQHEENQLLARAAAERRNPAQMAHELARQRGYTQPAKPAAPPPGNSSVDLNRIAAGQQQSGSLSDAGGNTGRDTGDIEITDLLKMNDAEFGAFIAKYPARFRRLKGAAH